MNQEGSDLKTTAWRGIATLGIVGLMACGSQSSSWPNGAFLFVNPTSLTYIGDGGTGTVSPSLAAYVGTSEAQSIDLQDHGTDPLTITSVVLNGPSPDFQLVLPSPAGSDGGPITIDSYPTAPAHAFVSFYFAPTKAGPETATIVITTNSTVDGGVTIIPITALGVSADAGQFNQTDGG